MPFSIPQNAAVDEHFDRIVAPAVVRFRDAEKALVTAKSEDSGLFGQAQDEALRAARNAVMELHHHSDVVWAECRGTLPSDIGGVDALRQRVQSDHCRMLREQPIDDLDILADVADAFKHHVANHTSKRRLRRVTSSRATITTGSGWGELSYGEGNWGGVEQVLVQLGEGRKRALSAILQNVIDAWRLAMGRPLPAIGQ